MRSLSQALILAGLVTACGASEQSEVKVLGGAATKNVPSFVTLSAFNDKGESMGLCGAQFVRDDLLLTAGHCLHGVKAVSIYNEHAPFNRSDFPIQSSEFIFHPQYSAIVATGVGTSGKAVTTVAVLPAYAYADMAFVRLPKGTAPSFMITPLASVAPAAGDPVYLVGNFATRLTATGALDPTSITGANSMARNSVASIDPAQPTGVIQISGVSKFDGSDASDYQKGVYNNAESGSALYNSRFELIGLSVSATQEKLGASFKVTNAIAHILTPSAQKFIASVLQLPAPIPAPAPAPAPAPTPAPAPAPPTATAFATSAICTSGVLKFSVKDTGGNSSSGSINSCEAISASCSGTTITVTGKGGLSVSTSTPSVGACLALKDEIATFAAKPLPAPAPVPAPAPAPAPVPAPTTELKTSCSNDVLTIRIKDASYDKTYFLAGCRVVAVGCVGLTLNVSTRETSGSSMMAGALSTTLPSAEMCLKTAADISKFK